MSSNMAELDSQVVNPRELAGNLRQSNLRTHAFSFSLCMGVPSTAWEAMTL